VSVDLQLVYLRSRLLGKKRKPRVARKGNEAVADGAGFQKKGRLWGWSKILPAVSYPGPWF
jgi:hypothetical protein